MSKRLVLFAHGSGDPRWRQPFERITERIQWELGPDRVRLAYMEFVPPTLADVVAEAAADRVTRIDLLPLFFSSGGHVSRDIPAQIADACRRFPDLHVEMHPPVGEDPRFAELICSIAAETLSDPPR